MWIERTVKQQKTRNVRWIALHELNRQKRKRFFDNNILVFGIMGDSEQWIRIVAMFLGDKHMNDYTTIA